MLARPWSPTGFSVMSTSSVGCRFRHLPHACIVWLGNGEITEGNGKSTVRHALHACIVWLGNGEVTEGNGKATGRYSFLTCWL